MAGDTTLQERAALMGKMQLRTETTLAEAFPAKQLDTSSINSSASMFINSNARSPDAKEPGTNQTGVVGSNALPQLSSSPKLRDVNAGADSWSSAVRAEQEWLAAVSSNPTHSAANNKIRLISNLIDAGINDSRINVGLEQVHFELTPEISEQKSVSYGEYGDLRAAASIMFFNGSPSRKWNLNATFLARTQDEANKTWRDVQMLRSWTLPDKNYRYGLDAAMPRVLKLYGYGRTWQGIPVVITSLSVEYPSDVDYIPAADINGSYASSTEENITPSNFNYGSLVPVIQKVSISLTETRTPKELWQEFNLDKFKLGVLPSW